MIDTTPLISLVVPVYNVAGYLERCLFSINEQTFKNFEVIFVDDGSTDGSDKILDKWCGQTAIISKLIHKKNEGVSVARNVGLKYTSGKYICFIDSDDMIAPDYLANMYLAVTENNCELAICKRRDISDSFSISDYIQYLEGNTPTPVTYRKTSLEIMRKLLYRDISVGIWNVMAKKELLMKNHLSFAEGFKYSEDLEFVWRSVACSAYIAIVNKKLYLYRKRRNSAMQKFDIYRRDGYILFQRLEKFICYKQPAFSVEFSRYGVAYWIWSNIWQAAQISNKYKHFRDSISFMETNKMENLLDFPVKKVRFSARLFLMSKKMYYYLLKIYFMIV